MTRPTGTRCLVACALALLAGAARAQVVPEFRIVADRRDPRWAALTADPSVDDLGRTYFVATERLAGGSTRTGIFAETDTGVQALAATGDPAPEVTGAVISQVQTQTPYVTPDGRAVIVGTISGPGVTSANDDCVWMFTAPGTGFLIWREGDPAIESGMGVFFGSSSNFSQPVILGLSSAGTMLMRVPLRGAGVVPTLNDSAIYSATAPPGEFFTQVLRLGESTPNGVGGTVASVRIARASFDGRAAFLVDRSSAGPAAYAGLLTGPLESVVGTGELMPSPPGGTISAVGDARPFSGSTYLLWLSSGSYSGWFWRTAAAITSFRSASIAGLPAGASISFEQSVIGVCQGRWGIVPVRLSGAGVAPANDSALIRWQSSAVATFLSREGDLVPGEPAGGLVFPDLANSLSLIACAPNGTFAMLPRASNPSPAGTPLLLTDQNDIVRRVLRVGDTLAAPLGSIVLSDVSFAAPGVETPAPRSVSGDRRLVFRASTSTSPAAAFVAARMIDTPTGACCAGSTCSVVSQPQCTGAFRVFAGAGLACNPAGNATAPCCRANFNQSGGVTVQDVFDFLTAWFAGDTLADFSQSGGVSVQDVFGFVAAWFAGCS